jgi:hypothetical protein
MLLRERVNNFSYEQIKDGLAMNGNTGSVTVNCGRTGIYSDEMLEWIVVIKFKYAVGSRSDGQIVCTITDSTDKC